MTLPKKIVKALTGISMLFAGSAQAALEPNAAETGPTRTILINVVCPSDGEYHDKYTLSDSQNAERALMCARFWYGAFLCVPSAEFARAAAYQGLKQKIVLTPMQIDPIRFDHPDQDVTARIEDGVSFVADAMLNMPNDRNVVRARLGAWLRLAEKKLQEASITGERGSGALYNVMHSPEYKAACPFPERKLSWPLALTAIALKLDAISTCSPNDAFAPVLRENTTLTFAGLFPNLAAWNLPGSSLKLAAR